MAALQLKAALLILGIAAGRKLLFRFFSPRLPEWLWMLVGIRLLLPQGIGIPILSVRHLCAPYPCDPFAAPLPGVAVWVRWSGAGAVLLILLANALRFYGRMRQKEDLQNDAVSIPGGRVSASIPHRWPPHRWYMDCSLRKSSCPRSSTAKRSTNIFCCTSGCISGGRICGKKH